MTRTTLNSTQQLRAQQVHTAHTNMKQLSEATKEAMKCYDKYLESVENVMTCLLNSSDNWEEIRTSLGTECARIDPIAPSSGRLAAAYNTWKVSKEVRALHEELAKLNELTKTGRTYTKAAKTDAEELEKVAKKNAEVTSAEYEAKIAQRSGKAKEKLLKEQRKQEEEMKGVENELKHDMAVAGSWWSGNLIHTCEHLYDAYASLGRRTLSCFSEVGTPPLPPAHGLTSSADGSHPTERRGGGAHVGVGPAAPYYNPAMTAAGVPLEFNSVRVPAAAL